MLCFNRPTHQITVSADAILNEKDGMDSPPLGDKIKLLTIQSRKREERPEMNCNPTTLGIDLSKNVFHFVILDGSNQVTTRGKLSRTKRLEPIPHRTAEVIAVEACGSSY